MRRHRQGHRTALALAAAHAQGRSSMGCCIEGGRESLSRCALRGCRRGPVVPSPEERRFGRADALAALESNDVPHAARRASGVDLGVRVLRQVVLRAAPGPVAAVLSLFACTGAALGGACKRCPRPLSRPLWTFLGETSCPKTANTGMDSNSPTPSTDFFYRLELTYRFKAI